MDRQPSVLIVDRSEETCEVLQTVLQRRGVRTLSTHRTAAAQELVRRHEPDLIVFDLEIDDAPGGEPRRQEMFFDGPSDYQPRIILLGNLRGRNAEPPRGEFVAKPYHYGPLIRKIEELLDRDIRAGNLGRADVVRHSRSRSGQPLRAD